MTATGAPLLGVGKLLGKDSLTDTKSIWLSQKRTNQSQTSTYCILQSIVEEVINELGNFENLMQVVAAGFDASSEPAMFMNKNNEQGGLLIMNNDDIC